MRFPVPPNVKSFRLVDAGRPNQERIEILVEGPYDLAQLAVLVGLVLADGSAVPVWDNLYWFGDIMVTGTAWLVLHTGLGQYAVTGHPTSGIPIYSYYWGRSGVMFASPNAVPVLVQIGALLVAPPRVTNAFTQPPPSTSASSTEGMKGFLEFIESNKRNEPLLGDLMKPKK